MDWHQAQEVRETHRRMGARNQPYRCSACGEEWPCQALNDAAEAMRQTGAEPCVRRCVAAQRCEPPIAMHEQTTGVPRPGDIVWIDDQVVDVEYPHWFRVATVESAPFTELSGWVFLTGYPVAALSTRRQSFRFVSTDGLIIRRPG